MTTLYVYLYEDGVKHSFENLSGQEVESITHAVEGIVEFDDFDGFTDMEYAIMQLSDEAAAKVTNKKIAIKPAQYGIKKWSKNVQVEFLTSPTDGSLPSASNGEGKIGVCKAKLESMGIKTKQEFRKWAVLHHSDKTGTAMSDEEKDVLACGMAVFSDKALGGRRKTKKRTSKRKVSKRKQGTRKRRA